DGRCDASTTAQFVPLRTSDAVLRQRAHDRKLSVNSSGRLARCAPARRGSVAMSDVVSAWIELEGAHNVRDLGGLPTPAGPTHPRVLLRGDALDAVTAADVDLLVHDVGVAHVVDLRAVSERMERAEHRLRTADLTISEIPVIEERHLEMRQAARAA